MASNPYVDMYQREESAAEVVENAKGWRARFARDARLSRSMSWWQPFKRGHWSWTVTRAQYKRFVRADDPLMAYPDEIFDGWVHDPWVGLTSREQKRVFDKYVASLTPVSPTERT